MLYNYSLRLETGKRSLSSLQSERIKAEPDQTNFNFVLDSEFFVGRPADYAFMLLFNWIAITLIAFFSNSLLLMMPMVLSVIYVWCQLNRETIVRFWFNTQFKAMYLPWVLFGFNLVINGG
jgi:derlin-1